MEKVCTLLTQTCRTKQIRMKRKRGMFCVKTREIVKHLSKHTVMEVFIVSRLQIVIR